MGKPYVISEELDLSRAYPEQIINLNELENFRASLDEDLTKMGKKTLWIPSNTMRTGIAKMVDGKNLPIVSLDDRYVDFADQYLGMSRGVDTRLNDIGYVARAGYPRIDKQMNTIARLAREVVLVDDVLFSGEMVEWVVDELAQRDVKVGAVVCGIAMAEGIERLNTLGITVDAGEAFEDVDDEICERDFAMVPGSGRRVSSISANALYFDKLFGKPEQWASIPASAVSDFSINSLERSANLLKGNVQIETIGRFVGYPSEGNAQQRIMERLEV